MYLGVTLDRSLNYRDHLVKISAKIKTRNNLLQKLTGTTWGAKAETLRTSAMALCYSVAEYCAPVWCRSAHTSMIDSQLNSTMRIISGTIKSTPTQWLPVLCNIAPPGIRRSEASCKLWDKLAQRTDLPIHFDIQQPPPSRLPSRNPIWKTSFDRASIEDKWQKAWQENKIKNGHLIENPSQRLFGMNLNRKGWSTLNRFRTGHGRCREMEHKWGRRENSLCDCGEVQTMNHLVKECRLGHCPGGLEALNQGVDGAVEWMLKMGSIR